MQFTATCQNINSGAWRISIDYSEELKDFLLNMPENVSHGAYITVAGYDVSFRFAFPREFKNAYRQMESQCL
jgi:hypothetical protein